MQNRMAFWSSASVLVSCVTVFVGCASGPKNSEEPGPTAAAVQLKAPVTLEFKGEAGREESMKYYSASVVETTEQGQLTRRKEEAVEFTVVTRTQDVEKDHLVWEMETVEKDGTVNLHDLAFPELKEALEYKIKPTGEVLQAGPYPPTSVFFVPPVPLPKTTVSPGDTWTLTHQWTSMSSGIPLKVDLVTIFKSALQCGSGTCAILEVSGDVSIVGPLQAKLKFESEIKGYLVYAIDKGTMIASRIANREAMLTGPTGMRVHSCMVGVMNEPSPKIPGLIEVLQCDPEKFSTQILAN